MMIKYSLLEYMFCVVFVCGVTTAHHRISASPGAVGKVCKNTPPFFTKEFYAQQAHKPNVKNTADIKKETKVR